MLRDKGALEAFDALPKYAESWLKLTLETTGNRIRPKWWSQPFFLCCEPEDVGGPAIPEGSGWSGVWRNISSSVCFLEVITGYTKFYPRVEKIMFLRKISIEPVYSNGWETMTFFLQSQTASISWPQTFSWNLQKSFVNSNMVRFYPCSWCILSCSESQIPQRTRQSWRIYLSWAGLTCQRMWFHPNQHKISQFLRTDFG